MKASFIFILLGVSAFGLASANFDGKVIRGRPPVWIKTNASGIVTIADVNAALNKTFPKWARLSGWSKNKTGPAVDNSPLATFVDVDVSPKKGYSVGLLGNTAFQVNYTSKWNSGRRLNQDNQVVGVATGLSPVVFYIATTTNGTNVTGSVFVTLPKPLKSSAESDDVLSATFDKNSTKPGNGTKPDSGTKPGKPFAVVVKKQLAANETTATVTVADINGSFKGRKLHSFSPKPDLATITSATGSKFSHGATVGFNATVSNTSFTVTLTNPNAKYAGIQVSVVGTNTRNATVQGIVDVKIFKKF